MGMGPARAVLGLLVVVCVSLPPTTAFPLLPPASSSTQRLCRVARGASSGEPSSPASADVSFRRGRPSDFGSVFSAMVSERMNPLVLDMSRFLCAVDTRQGDEGRLLGFGQVRPLPGVDDALELASVYVQPEARGRGIGSLLVGRLVQDFRQEDQQGPSGRDLYILTLRERSGFYTPHGFTEVAVEQAPAVLQTEYRLGRVVTKLSGRGPDALIIMKLAQ